MTAWELAADRGLWTLSDPRLSNPSQDEQEVLLWSEELWSICSSLYPSPTHLSHATNINPFENKVWEIYFYKDVCSFVHWSSSLLLTMFPLIFVSVCGYTTKAYDRKTNFNKFQICFFVSTKMVKIFVNVNSCVDCISFNFSKLWELHVDSVRCSE